MRVEDEMMQLTWTSKAVHRVTVTTQIPLSVYLGMEALGLFDPERSAESQGALQEALEEDDFSTGNESWGEEVEWVDFHAEPVLTPAKIGDQDLQRIAQERILHHGTSLDDSPEELIQEANELTDSQTRQVIELIKGAEVSITF